MSNKKLLFSITKKDFKITYFSGSGKGGQHRNKRRNCVRLKHIESGAITTGQSHRERKANMKEALHAMVRNFKFKKWHNQKVREVLDGITLEEKVDKMMHAKNLKIEIRNLHGAWEELNE